MCWADKCCLVVPLDLGVILMSFFSFVISTFLSALSATVLILERELTSNENGYGNVTSLNETSHEGVTSLKQASHEHFKNVLQWDIDKKSFDIIVAVLLLIGLLGMVFSVLLVVGVRMRKSGLVLAYFSFGILMAIITVLTSLLEMLANYWIIASVQFIASLMFIHWLVVVHTIYERMQMGQHFGDNPHVKMNDEDAPEDV